MANKAPAGSCFRNRDYVTQQSKFHVVLRDRQRIHLYFAAETSNDHHPLRIDGPIRRANCSSGFLNLLKPALQIRWNAGTLQTFKMKMPLQGHYLWNVAHTVIARLIPE